MKKLILLPLLLATAASAQPPGSGYTLLFEDNFDGGKLNEADWVYRLDRRGGEANFSNINGLNRKENVRVADGQVHIKVDYEDVNGKKEFTGGGLITKKRFGYGYYEARFRPFMKGNHGVHSAFWQRGPAPNVLAGQKLDPTTAVEQVLFEIDSSELDNPKWTSTNNIYDVIAPKGLSDGYPWPARFHIPVDPRDGWFVDAYEYTPEGVIFYDNGKEVARAKFDRIRGQQNVWLTVLNGFGKDIDTSVFPGEGSFDYFRFYAKDYPGANLLANEGFEYNLDSIDPQNPISWFEEGDCDASQVANGGACKDQAKLRQASDKPYKVTTSQTLQFIPNGTYAASAMVRSSGGQKVAQMRVTGTGSPDKSVDIPAAAEWKRVSIGNIEVKNNSATLAFVSDAGAGQWLEVDDTSFFKPAKPGQEFVENKPFQVFTDPIWNILEGNPMAFGDGRFGFFGREAGRGDALTVMATVRPAKLQDQVILERFPKSGPDGGWSIRLNKDGSAAFRIGSKDSFSEVTAKDAYKPGDKLTLACVFDKGRASIFLNGKEAATQSGIPQNTHDKKAAGSFGVHRTSTSEPRFVGEMQDLKIYNRALNPAELK